MIFQQYQSDKTSTSIFIKTHVVFFKNQLLALDVQKCTGLHCQMLFCTWQCMCFSGEHTFPKVTLRCNAS